MIDAAKELIQEYKNITLEQLEEFYKDIINFEYGKDVLHEITGFGYIGTCILCIHAEGKCENCIHKYNPNWEDKRDFPCTDDIYTKMANAKDANFLYETIQERIKYLEKLISYAEQQADSSI